MKKEMFEELLSSVREGGAILRGGEGARSLDPDRPFFGGSGPAVPRAGRCRLAPEDRRDGSSVEIGASHSRGSVTRPKSQNPQEMHARRSRNPKEPHPNGHHRH